MKSMWFACVMVGAVLGCRGNDLETVVPCVANVAGNTPSAIYTLPDDTAEDAALLTVVITTKCSNGDTSIVGSTTAAVNGVVKVDCEALSACSGSGGTATATFFLEAP